MKKNNIFKNLKTQITLIFFLCSGLMYSQTFQNDIESEDVNGEEIILDSDTVSPEVLSNLGFDTSFSPQTATIVGNSVMIQQIGDFNQANVFAATESSDIVITQNGDSNEVDLRYTAQSVFSLINQQGDSNFISDFVSDANATPALDLTQEGNNLSFERFGVNNLTNSLKFTQTVASPVIVVRSYQ